MKKLSLSAVLLFVSIVMIIPKINAQTGESKPSFNNVSVPNSERDESTIMAPTTKAEIRAFKNFSKNYKQAGNVTWYYSGKLLVANFSENNSRKHVMYLSNGQWFRTLISYDESQLPEDVMAMVKRSYPKFRITTITEVQENDMIAYFVNLENEREIRQVISYEDQVWTYKRFRKQ